MIVLNATLTPNLPLLISSQANLFLPALTIITLKDNSPPRANMSKSGLMNALFLSSLMIGVLILFWRSSTILLSLILLVVLDWIEPSLCMMLEDKLPSQKMQWRINLWPWLGILWNLSTLLLVMMILIATLLTWENLISSRWSIKITLVLCKIEFFKDPLLILLLLVWILIIHQLAENLPLALMIRLSESSLLILVRVEKSIMAKECKSNESFVGKILANNFKNRVFSICYTLDGRYILSGSEDMNVRIWKTKASDPIGQV